MNVSGTSQTLFPRLDESLVRCRVVDQLDVAGVVVAHSVALNEHLSRLLSVHDNRPPLAERILARIVYLRILRVHFPSRLHVAGRFVRLKKINF